MKILTLSLTLFISCNALAQVKSLYLSDEDQKYYKNDSFDGNNQRERIDTNVKEINKLHSEISSMKAELQKLRQEVDELKKGK